MTLDARELHRRAADAFGDRVAAIRPDQWHQPTPCEGWDVRMLVHHLVYENRWTPPLLEGLTVAEVGDRFEGDLLGDDPAAEWEDSASQAVAAVGAPGALGRTVHLSFGLTPAREYVMQLFADLFVHSWDLARGIGADDRLDPELVDACASWFAAMEDGYRSAGAVGPRPDLAGDAGAQTRLLAMFGRRG